jgi:hypothetical protein
MDDATYYGTTDSGTDLYYGPGGSFMDENGVPVALASGTDINLQSGDTYTYQGPTAPPPPPNAGSVVTAGGDNNSMFSGLGDMFSGIGNAVSKTIGVLNPAKPTTIPGAVGAYVYNPKTGQYMPAVQGTTAISSSTLVLIAIVGVVALAIAFRK